MTGRWWIGAALPAALAVGLGGAQPRAASLGTTENTQFLAVWVGDGFRAAGGAPALLNLPPGWIAGDASVVIAPGGPWEPGQRDRLVSALLEAGAAVLELGEPRGSPRPAALRHEISDAHRTLREAFGAGLVVGLGAGEGGQAALDVADAEAGAGFRAAAVRLGPGTPGDRAAAAPVAWPPHAPPVCGVLAAAQPAGSAGFAQLCAAGLALAR